jgi:SnoaL-like domain
MFADPARRDVAGRYRFVVETIETVIAKEAIRSAALRYCQGIDRCDEELIKSAYHPDAFDDHGTFKGNAWEFAGYVSKSLLRYKATKHVVTNHSISVDVSGSSATGEMYVLAYHLRGSDDGDVVDTWWGRYIDEYSCRDGDWRISSRVVVHEWTAQVPVVAPMPIKAELFRQGSFDRIMS